MKLTVSKFGGTSVGSAEAIKKVKKIILEKPERKIVVVSAVSGVTDLLIKAASSAEKGKNWKVLYNEIKKKHLGISQELGMELDLSIYFNELESILANVESAGELTPRNRDYILSFGERLSSKIVAKYLGDRAEIRRINARHIIKTNSNFGNAKLDNKKTEQAIRKNLMPYLDKFEKIIITGFIGANENGEYTTFSRGGSDYSAAVIAGFLEAKELEIWTDVDGILTADPRIIPQAKIVENVSYAEAAELSYFGAKVLHPKTIKPVVKKKIPIRVCNTFNAKKPGTLVTKKSPKGIKSISKKNSSYIINLYAAEMIESFGFLGNVFSVFKKHKVVADVVSTGEANVSVTIDQKPDEDFLKELKKYAEVKVMPKKTIICIVGQDLNSDGGILARLFHAIREYPVYIISQSSSARNITIVVDKNDDKKVVELIYKELFKNNK